jgi:hypothetical protein
MNHMTNFASIDYPPWSLRIDGDDHSITPATAVAVYAGIKGPQALAVLAAHGSPTTSDDILQVTIIDNGCEFIFGFDNMDDIEAFIHDLSACGRLPDVIAPPTTGVIG